MPRKLGSGFQVDGNPFNVSLIVIYTDMPGTGTAAHVAISTREIALQESSLYRGIRGSKNVEVLEV